jgi:hypothetical protein
MTRDQRRQPFLVEATDQLRNRIVRLATGAFSRCLIRLASGHRQQHFGPSNVAGWLTPGTRDLFEDLTFFVGQWTKGIVTPTTHIESACSCGC